MQRSIKKKKTISTLALVLFSCAVIAIVPLHVFIVKHKNMQSDILTQGLTCDISMYKAH